MKSSNLILGVAMVAVAFTSCKNEKQDEAQKSVDTYVVYVDSLGNVDSKEVKTNWQAVNDAYEMRIANAQAALDNIKDRKAAEEKIEASKMKFQDLKDKVEAEMAAEKATMPTASNPKQQLRNALFGEGKIGDDMNFDWVNKDNIHNVYQQFIHTAEDNKDKYSREDWDEIKLMYEALDSRKNTVEKEGLSSEDNRKIAGLKIKFGPMMMVNRIGAKSEEMRDAKK